MAKGKIAGLALVGFMCLGVMLVTSSCAVQLGLKRADTDLTGPPQPEPAVLAAFQQDGAIQNLDEWIERREILKTAFEETVYGPYPEGITGRLIQHRIVDVDYANGMGQLEEFKVQIGEAGPVFNIAMALPKSALDAQQSVPVIIAESFCQNRAAMDHDGLSPPEPPLEGGMCGGDGFMAWAIKTIFGEFIEGPPMEDVLAAGYAYASIYASEIAADSSDTFFIGLDKIAQETSAENAPVGIVSAWAAGFGWALDVLEADARIDANRTAIWGHSRHGKAALWAAAHDARVDAVISHQSGTGGATLTRSLNGESVKKITESYGFWFAPAFASYAERENDIPIDQHQLIALAAPKPVFLGNSWNDVWSDPNGAFRAAQGADPAYELYGVEGFVQTGLKDKRITSGELVYQISKGRHGIRRQDWDDFLSFLDRWLK